MAATFKPFRDSDLPDAAPQSQTHPSHYFSGYQCIKTNGSLVHSCSTEGGQISLVNGGGKGDHDKEDDVDDVSPQLKDVEALLRGYPHTSCGNEDGDVRIAVEGDDDDDDDAANGSSPILLSECPEFQAYLHPLQVCDRTEDQSSNIDDEIVFSFMPRKDKKSISRHANGNDEEGTMWELIEAEAEALCMSEEGLARLQCNGVKRPSDYNHAREAKPLSSGGVAALMTCAASEMSRLRDGAAALRRGPCQRLSRSPNTPSPPPSPIRQVVLQTGAEPQQERTLSTTGTLTSLLHIQLAQITRISEAVRIEFSNQLAHERALMELLELEHTRVRSEVRMAERQGKTAPSDLVNQLRHLRERLDQQKTLIDDLEYQYLEDKTKYEEEKESLMAQLKLQQETPPEASSPTSSFKNVDSETSRERSPEDAYTYPSPVFPSASNPLPRTSSPIYSTPNANASPHFRSETVDPALTGIPGDHFFENGGASLNAVETPPHPADGEVPLLSGLSVRNPDSCHQDEHNPLPPSHGSDASPGRYPPNDRPTQKHKASLPLNSSPVFQQQNGHSFDESYFSGREDLSASPHTSSSLPGGLNPHVATTSSSSSLLHTGKDHQSSCTSSFNNIFRAVPPLLPTTSLSSDQRLWIREDSSQLQCSNEVRIRPRQRTSSTATRRVWQDGEARPLTRYLPVPDDISFDLRQHLEVICGHILCSPLLMPHLHVDATTCAGYLYKVDSRVTITTPNTKDDDDSKSQPCEVEYSDVSVISSSSGFFSPTTRRARRRTTRVTSPSGGGGFMAALFNRTRRGKRRWFVLDRRRRLLIYYSCHTSKSSGAASLMKPKDVISFTDIIDVYPDRQARKSNNTGFCLLLVASCPPPPSLVSPQGRPMPTRTRILSLAAPSPEAMRVWVDALFTCAGAYLCLPNSHHPLRRGADGQR